MPATESTPRPAGGTPPFSWAPAPAQLFCELFLQCCRQASLLVQERSTSSNNKDTSPSNRTAFQFHVDFVHVPLSQTHTCSIQIWLSKAKREWDLKVLWMWIPSHWAQGSWVLRGQHWRGEAQKEAQPGILAPLTRTFLNLPDPLSARVGHFIRQLPQGPQKEAP